jgi:hypothetical protein
VRDPCALGLAKDGVENSVPGRFEPEDAGRVVEATEKRGVARNCFVGWLSGGSEPFWFCGWVPCRLRSGKRDGAGVCVRSELSCFLLLFQHTYVWWRAHCKCYIFIIIYMFSSWCVMSLRFLLLTYECLDMIRSSSLNLGGSSSK